MLNVTRNFWAHEDRKMQGKMYLYTTFHENLELFVDDIANSGNLKKYAIIKTNLSFWL